MQGHNMKTKYPFDSDGVNSKGYARDAQGISKGYGTHTSGLYCTLRRLSILINIAYYYYRECNMLINVSHCM